MSKVKKKKKIFDKNKSHIYAVDPFSNERRNPRPLVPSGSVLQTDYERHQRGSKNSSRKGSLSINLDSISLSQYGGAGSMYTSGTNSGMQSGYQSGMQSGAVSPSSMSETSEYETRSTYSFVNSSSKANLTHENSFRGSYSQSHSQTGSSTPSIISEDEFLIGDPMTLGGDSESTFVSPTQSIDSGVQTPHLRESLDSAKGSDFRKKLTEKMDYEKSKKNEKEEDEKEKQKQKQYSEEFLENLGNQDFRIKIKETETFFIFDQFSEVVASDSDELKTVLENNKRFARQVEDKKNKADNFTEKGVQTINKFSKNQYCDTKQKLVVNKEIFVSFWEIFDEYENLLKKEEKEREELEQLATLDSSNKVGDDENNEFEEDELIEEEPKDNDIMNNPDNITQVRSSSSSTSIFKNPKLLDSLRRIERIVVQNQFLEKQLKFNNIKLDSNKINDKHLLEILKNQEKEEEEKEAKKNNPEGQKDKKNNLEVNSKNSKKKSKKNKIKDNDDEFTTDDSDDSDISDDESELDEFSATDDDINEEEDSFHNKNVNFEDEVDDDDEEMDENGNIIKKQKPSKIKKSIEEEEFEDKISTLWKNSCNLTDNCSVQCMCWNPFNSDILAVGYISKDSSSNISSTSSPFLTRDARQKSMGMSSPKLASSSNRFFSNNANSMNNGLGISSKRKNSMRISASQHHSTDDFQKISIPGSENSKILCWTIKNPLYPERVINIPKCGIHSMNFSKENPHLLAVGFSNGTVSIYDIRKQDNEPVLITKKDHTGGVWDLKWVNRGKDVGERLHSVGVDGRVNCWSLKKGLSEVKELRRLKHYSKISNISKITPDVMISSQEPGGLCLDFDPTDPSIYLVGTEDNYIHKCSTSYQEHYLETYIGHNGPVYQINWNPKDKDVFISCSADWTVKIWNQKKKHPIYSIEPYSSNKSNQISRSRFIQDVAWSPDEPTLFGSVSITGSLELWDLSFSTLKPKVFKQFDNPLNKIIISTNNRITVGDDNGTVHLLNY